MIGACGLLVAAMMSVAAAAARRVRGLRFE
jgi:hypothetical protein